MITAERLTDLTAEDRERMALWDCGYTLTSGKNTLWTALRELALQCHNLQCITSILKLGPLQGTGVEAAVALSYKKRFGALKSYLALPNR